MSTFERIIVSVVISFLIVAVLIAVYIVLDEDFEGRKEAGEKRLER